MNNGGGVTDIANVAAKLFGIVVEFKFVLITRRMVSKLSDRFINLFVGERVSCCEVFVQSTAHRSNIRFLTFEYFSVIRVSHRKRCAKIVNNLGCFFVALSQL